MELTVIMLPFLMFGLRLSPSCSHGRTWASYTRKLGMEWVGQWLTSFCVGYCKGSIFNSRWVCKVCSCDFAESWANSVPSQVRMFEHTWSFFIGSFIVLPHFIWQTLPWKHLCDFVNASEVKEAPWTAAIFLGILVSTLAAHGDVNWPKKNHNFQDEYRRCARWPHISNAWTRFSGDHGCDLTGMLLLMWMPTHDMSPEYWCFCAFGVFSSAHSKSLPAAGFAFGVVNMVLVLILECSMRAYENLGEQKQCHGCCLSTTLSHDRLRWQMFYKVNLLWSMRQQGIVSDLRQILIWQKSRLKWWEMDPFALEFLDPMALEFLLKIVPKRPKCLFGHFKTFQRMALFSYFFRQEQ